jgi:hypothetical protein
MSFTPDPPFEKLRGDLIRSKDWNDAIKEIQRLDTAKVNKTGDVMTGPLNVQGAIRAGNSDLYFTETNHNHTGIGNASGFAAIENAADYGALMILGRAGTAKGRYVRLWDYLQVNGNMDVTGHVGIGTSTPQATLHIKGNAGILNMEGQDHTYIQWYPLGVSAGRKAWVGYGSAGTTAFTIQNDAGRMHIYGTELLYLLNTSGVIIGREWGGNGNLQVQGTASKPGGGSWSTLSDISLKKNVGPMQGALGKLLQLRGVTFEWKEPQQQGNLTGTQMGMVAQEVEKVFPEWVEEGSDGYKILSIRGFEALVVEAFRDLNARVSALETSRE